MRVYNNRLREDKPGNRLKNIIEKQKNVMNEQYTRLCLSGSYLRDAFVGLVEQNLRHPLDGDRERNDRVLPAVGAVAVGAPRAQRAEDRVARLAEEQLLVYVHRALGDDLAPLPGHQVQELVHEERGRKRGHASPRDDDQFTAYGAPEGAGVAGWRGRYSG